MTLVLLTALHLEEKRGKTFIMDMYSLLCIKPDFIPSHIIQTLMSSKSDEYSDAVVILDNHSQGTSDHRRTKCLSLPQEVNSYLLQSINQIYNEHLKSIYMQEVKHIEPPQFLRYDVHGHYDMHNDSESYVDGKLTRVIERDVSILMYLNDDYEGGQIEFTKLGITLRPKVGMLLAFPSYLEFEHKVHPVTRGVRYNIVSWVGTRERIYERPYDAKREIRRPRIFSDQGLHTQILRRLSERNPQYA